jgi:hypothetical protein
MYRIWNKILNQHLEKCDLIVFSAEFQLTFRQKERVKVVSGERSNVFEFRCMGKGTGKCNHFSPM